MSSYASFSVLTYTNCFIPEPQREPARDVHAPRHVHDGTVHALGLAVTGLVSGPTALPNDARALAEQVYVIVLSSGVGTQNLDLVVGLLLEEHEEGLEQICNRVLGARQ
jgi:hypothetical protein